MGKHRTKEEKLKRVRRGSRYVGLDLNQYYWECLKLEAASEELTETDILRRIIRTWSEGLPSVLQEKARAEAARVEVWKAEVLRAREEARLQAKQAKPDARRGKIRGKARPKVLGTFLRRREGIKASN